MSNLQKKAMVIEIEGSDGSGKETQTKLLKEKLEKAGLKTEIMSFPNYESESSGPVKLYLDGKCGNINSLDAYQTSILYAADRVCHLNKLNDLIKNNDVVLLDRYVGSNLIYQSAKIYNNSTKEVIDFIKYWELFEYDLLSLPKPDLVLYLDMDYSVSKKLRKNRKNKSCTKNDINELNDEYMKQVSDIGRIVANYLLWENIKCYNSFLFGIYKAPKSIEEISNNIFNYIKAHIEGSTWFNKLDISKNYNTNHKDGISNECN